MNRKDGIVCVHSTTLVPGGHGFATRKFRVPVPHLRQDNPGFSWTQDVTASPVIKDDMGL